MIRSVAVFVVFIWIVRAFVSVMFRLGYAVGWTLTSLVVALRSGLRGRERAAMGDLREALGDQRESVSDDVRGVLHPHVHEMHTAVVVGRVRPMMSQRKRSPSGGSLHGATVNPRRKRR